MTHSAAMAAEILPGKTILEALNTDLVCDAINTAMRELFLQIVYGRTQSAFSEGGLIIGAGLEDLGKGLRSQVGTLLWHSMAKGRSLPWKWLKVTSKISSWIRMMKSVDTDSFTWVNSWMKSRRELMLTKH